MYQNLQFLPIILSRLPLLLIHIFFLLNFSHCSTGAPLNPWKSLSPPLGLEAKPNSAGNGILLSFYAANDEEDFDGFNVYISEIENIADINPSGTNPLIPDGIAPTIPSNPVDFDTNKLRTYTVIYRNNDLIPLTSGTKYFFILRAHSSNGFVSVPSNEAAAITP